MRGLQTPYWREVCRIVRLRDGHRCRACGAAYPLEVHHKSYSVNGASIVGREKEHLECLVTLCARCHQREHENKS